MRIRYRDEGCIAKEGTILVTQEAVPLTLVKVGSKSYRLVNYVIHAQHRSYPVLHSSIPEGIPKNELEDYAERYDLELSIDSKGPQYKTNTRSYIGVGSKLLYGGAIFVIAQVSRNRLIVLEVESWSSKNGSIVEVQDTTKLSLKELTELCKATDLSNYALLSPND